MVRCHRGIRIVRGFGSLMRTMLGIYDIITSSINVAIRKHDDGVLGKGGSGVSGGGGSSGSSSGGGSHLRNKHQYIYIQ